MSSLEFKLPDIGEGVHEGEIVRWIVAEGTSVNEDEPVVEVMTDKATVEIPAPASGVVSKHLFAEGDVANVGDVIFTLDGGAAAAAAAAPVAEVAAPAVEAPVAAPAAPATGGATLEFKLPDIGEGVHEGEIVRWIVAEGGEVAEDDPVVEVMTDKATVEIPAPAAGVVQSTLVAEGEVANVGDVIFVLATSGGGAAAPAAAVATPVAVVPADPNKKVLAAPATRRLARELNVDLTTIIGTGPNGRVKPEDVRAASAAPVAPAAAATAPVAAPAVTAPTTTPAPTLPTPQVIGAREVEEIPFRGIRRKISEAMVRSKYTAPHFSLIEEVDCTEMVAARTIAKPVGERYGVKITFMGYIMKATAMALTEFPMLNAELDEEAGVIKQKRYVNLGIAVDTPNGLVVPVIKDANLKSILQLSTDLMDIAARARESKLKPDDFADSTFSISNAGNIGGTLATPIINFPEAAIMGVHSMRKMPRCVGDDIVARMIMNLSISIDHRIVDGADGARFMVRVRELLEEPSLMLL
ncbi:MAG: 2-oxo acid dehydrogenase subunit E2 [Planctomycetes bacterium]|nr:2-oxo acid dehydrogenase subunit E2 [Planctomycetota bacterium]